MPTSIPQAIVKLVRPGFAEYEPVSYKVVDSTRIDAVFDLSGAPHGLYDVTVINPGGAEADSAYRYLVEQTLPPDVTVGLGGPRVLAPGDTALYGFSLLSLTNVDTPYVYFQYGVPELGTNSNLANLPYLNFSTNLSGSPNVSNVPWADLASAVNTTGEILAPGYVVDLTDQGYVGESFTVLTYPGLAEALLNNPELLSGDEFDPKDPGEVAFAFHVLASATPLTADEFVAQQRQEAAELRQAILADPTASQTLVILAADLDAWTGLYLTALTQAGLLPPEDQPPSVSENPTVLSLMSVLAAGILAGPAGDQIITTGDLTTFFAEVRQWYGDNPNLTGSAAPPPASDYNLNESQPTHTESFTV